MWYPVVIVMFQGKLCSRYRRPTTNERWNLQNAEENQSYVSAVFEEDQARSDFGQASGSDGRRIDERGCMQEAGRTRQGADVCCHIQRYTDSITFR